MAGVIAGNAKTIPDHFTHRRRAVEGGEVNILNIDLAWSTAA
jgi:hypothetical protein